MGMMYPHTPEQIAHYNAWRKPLEDSYADVLPELATKYNAQIEDTGVIIIVSMVAGTYDLPGYGANDVCVTVLSPLADRQLNDGKRWTVCVFDYATAGNPVTEITLKKTATVDQIVKAVDTAMRRGGRYAISKARQHSPKQPA